MSFFRPVAGYIASICDRISQDIRVKFNVYGLRLIKPAAARMLLFTDTDKRLAWMELRQD